MQVRMLFLASLFLLFCFLTSCGGPPSISSTGTYSSLNGNWHLAGQGGPGGGMLQYPLLTFALFVDGSTLYGNGDVGVNCAGGGGGEGGSMSLTGLIAADGTFSMQSASALDSIQVSIQGNLPAQSGTTWNGNFTLTNGTTGFGCTINQSGTFTASQYPQFSGIYSGEVNTQVASTSGPSSNSVWNLAIQVTQDPATTLPRRAPLPPIFYFPLTSTITVSGSPCFTTATTSSSWLSSVDGDSFILSYIMNDGSTLQLSGTFADQTESTLQLYFVSVNGGGCNDEFGSGTLTLQP